MDSESLSYSEILSEEKYTVHPNGSLSILGAEKEDEGDYKIELSNSAGIVSEEIDLKIIHRIR